MHKFTNAITNSKSVGGTHDVIRSKYLRNRTRPSVEACVPSCAVALCENSIVRPGGKLKLIK